MPGKIYTGSKINTLPELMTEVLDHLQEAGFTRIFPAEGPLTFTEGAGTFVVESTATVNPRNEEQPYRIMFRTFTSENGLSLKAAVATPDQISNTGGVQSYPYATQMSGTTTLPYDGSFTIGQLGKKFNPRPYVQSGQSASPGVELGDVFITRDGRKDYNMSPGNTMSYYLVATDRGVLFYVWNESSDPAPLYSFFSIQYAVNKDTGETLLDMNSPIFVVYECDRSGLYKFVLNEADTTVPTRSVVADEDTNNSNGIINSAEQVAVKRGNKYLLTFPNRLNTDRYAYSEELDMIAYTSADVIGEDTLVPVRIYGEATDRLYRAMKANMPNNRGMRLCILVEGGGVPEASGG